MHVTTYLNLRPASVLWYLLMILARLKEDLVSFVKLFVLQLPLSYFWEKSNNLVLYIHNATRDLTKLPKHISFIVMEDDVDLVALSEAVVWCIILGISCISIADKQGLLTRHKQQLNNLVSHRLAQLNLPVKPVITQPPVDACSDSASSVSIVILSPASGRQLLATAAVSLAKETDKPSDTLIEGPKSPADIGIGDQPVDRCQVSVEQLDQLMRQLSGLIDADLAFRIGSTDSLFLPSPWHFRLAEFYQVPSQRALSPELFLNGLRFYSRVDQRLGK